MPAFVRAFLGQSRDCHGSKSSRREKVSISAEPHYPVTGPTVLRVGAMKPTKDDVGVGENVHYRFQSSSRV
jgi:hypothetical protein